MSKHQAKKTPAVSKDNGRITIEKTLQRDFSLNEGKRIDTDMPAPEEGIVIPPIKEQHEHAANEIYKSIEKAAGTKNKVYELLKSVVSKYPAESQIKLKAADIARQEVFKPYFKRADILKVWKEIFTADADNEEEIMQPYETEPEPYEGVVNGAELLTEIENRLRTHIVFSNPDIQAYSCALWVLATWCIDSFNFSPYLMITAPEKRCGKSQLLGLLASLSKKPLEAGNLTAPVLFRLAQKYHPTIFIDEADSFLSKDEDLQGVIKCGIERDRAMVYRLEKTRSGNFSERRFDCFGMKAISGISAKNISDTITDRCITIELKRKLQEEAMPKVRDVPKEVWDIINSKNAAFALDAAEWLKTHKPSIPKDISDRDADKWEPLISIAEYLDYAYPHEESPTYYGDKARNCAVVLSNTESDLPLNVELLSDIRDILLDPKISPNHEDYILSKILLNALVSDDDLRWGTVNFGNEMTQRQLSRRLSAFGIKSKKIRRENNKHGYMKEEFNDPFERYLKRSKEE
ncbi:DUF3631 domain-containing protein [uncultured Parasutterella sp.]|uniref:DUF3631 domain-containing protein n=1 Tax=uncultured Parasutterella sp. TaxID=1263098 RepID=UPI0025B669B1|nr:DUF3631 domain-containing protein [uncultured Parasutterella sp.]